MSEAQILAIAKDLMVTAFYLAGPAIIASMVVGMIVSLIQTVTSIQEQTLSFAPRMLAVLAVILLVLPWSMRVSIDFTMRMISIATKVTQ